MTSHDKDDIDGHSLLHAVIKDVTTTTDAGQQFGEEGPGTKGSLENENQSEQVILLSFLCLPKRGATRVFDLLIHFFTRVGHAYTSFQ
jgi:hypothetical protein